jgi:hypothetical protein
MSLPRKTIIEQFAEAVSSSSIKNLDQFLDNDVKKTVNSKVVYTNLQEAEKYYTAEEDGKSTSRWAIVECDPENLIVTHLVLAFYTTTKHPIRRIRSILLAKFSKSMLSTRTNVIQTVLIWFHLFQLFFVILPFCIYICNLFFILFSKGSLVTL